MKIQRWTLSAVIAGAVVLSAGTHVSPARADHGSLRAEVGIYYDELSPYGDWVDDSQYGSAWCPRHVGSDWQPYSEGRWVDSEYGWTWASDEPFGWATYHYGRWAFDPRYGWIWVPGTVWAPAWVSWQYGGGYVGWAPLPPSVGFDLNVGIRLGGLSLSAVLTPRDYIFVSERGFLEPRVGRYAVSRARNQDLWRRARNVTNYTVVNRRVINRGITVNNIERATGRRVPRFRVAEVDNRRSAGVGRDQLRVYRPPSARLRSIEVAVRNDAGVRPGVERRGRDRQPEARPAEGRRPEVKATPRGQERRNQVGVGEKPAPRGQERRNRVEPRQDDRPYTRPAERPRNRPPVVENRPHRPAPPAVNTPRPHSRPEANRPSPRQHDRPQANPQPRQRRDQRPAAKPNRPHGGGGGGGNASQPKQHGHGG